MADLLLVDDDTVVIPEQVRHAFPAPDIDRMNAEIERGYTGGSDS